MPYVSGRSTGQGSVRPCAHLAAIRPVLPHTAGCQQCVDRGDDWIGLRLCLSCGWVACSDDSPHHHARDHYEETDHPITTAPPPNQDGRWCYVHQRLV